MMGAPAAGRLAVARWRRVGRMEVADVTWDGRGIGCVSRDPGRGWSFAPRPGSPGPAEGVAEVRTPVCEELHDWLHAATVMVESHRTPEGRLPPDRAAHVAHLAGS